MNKTKKNSNVLKIIISILIVIILVLISFFGIYTKKHGKYSNIIKDYNLAMELEGNRTVILKPDDSTEKVTKDSEGNVVKDATEEESQQNGYTTEEVPVNGQDILNKDNFVMSKNILIKRLQEYNFDEYQIKQDMENGNMIIELAENDDTDSVLSIINQQGKFEIKDSTSEEVLMDNSMIKNATVQYNNTLEGTGIYLNIKFTNEGKEKLNQISNDYKTIEESSKTDTTDDTGNTEESEQKEIVMEIDGEKIITTSFDEPLVNGELQLTVGSTTTDTEKINDYIKQAKSTATVLSNGKLPVKYNADTNKYIKANSIKNQLIIIGSIITAIIVIASIILILKYKLKGILSALLSIGFIALSLLVIRYTNVYVSIAGLLGIILITMLNYALQFYLLSNTQKNEDEKLNNLKIYSKFICIIIPIFIIALVSSFATSILLNSFGMIVFWGILIILLYNIVFTNIILKD